MIYTLLEINGSVFDDAQNLSVLRSINSNDAASSVQAGFLNVQGRHSDSFSVGAEMKVWSSDSPITSTGGLLPVFVGVIEEVGFEGEGYKEFVKVKGRDYTCRLQDVTVKPVVYNSMEVGSIVRDVMSNNVVGISYSGVSSTLTTLDRVAYAHMSAYDVLMDLANLSGYSFWVDVNKDLTFARTGSVDCGVVLDSSNVVSSIFKNSNNGMFNEVWVYGDRQLVAAQNSFTANGGSVFTLDYKPSNTQVFVAGSTVPKRGGVWNMTSTPMSGTDYLVDYDGSRLIFVSGAGIGDNVPASGASVTVNYQRSRPIIKYSRDTSSQLAYGIKSKVVVDKNIKDPRTASKVASEALNSDALVQGDIRVKGFYDILPGKTVTVDLPFKGINDASYEVIGVSYDFSPQACSKEQVLSVRVNQKVDDLIDTIKQMKIDIRKLQAQDATQTDVISRMEVMAGSAGCKVKEWIVKTRNVGSAFILGHPSHGLLGASGFPLGASSVGAWTVVASGAY